MTETISPNVSRGRRSTSSWPSICFAGLSVSEFIHRLGTLKIPVARYSSEELSPEITAFA